jgi:hypothetical protein
LGSHMALTGAERQRAFRARNTAPSDYFERAALVAARHAAHPDAHRSAEALAKSLWPTDETTPLLLRAASAPATTTSATWAGDLVVPRAGDFVGSLGPLSAASKLIDAGVKVTLTGTNAVVIPKRQATTPNTDVTWVAQGTPIPTKNLAFDSIAVGPPHTLGVIVSLTHESVDSSDGERIVGLCLREDVAASLDASMFSSVPATADRPGGLLAGLTTLGATSTVSGTEAAMLGDLEKLASAIATAGGSGEVVYIMAPKQYVSAKLRLGTNRPVTIWPSAALAAGVVVAIEPQAFVSALGNLRIEASNEPTFVLETSPSDVVSSGTPAAGRTMSAWQTDLIVIRAVLEATWGFRQDGMVAFISGATWGA